MRNAIMIIVLLALATAVIAQPPAETKKYTLDLRDVWLTEAFDQLFSQSEDNLYVIAPEVQSDPRHDPGKIKVSLTMKDVNFEDALTALTKPHGLTWRAATAKKMTRVGVGQAIVQYCNVYTINIDKQPEMIVIDGTGPNVSLDIKDATLNEAISALFSEGWRPNKQLWWTPDSAIDLSQKITLKIKDVPFDSALEQVLQAAKPPLTYQKDKRMPERYMIFPSEAKGTPLINLEIDGVPIRNALEVLFKDSGYHHVIDQQVHSDILIRLQLRDVKFEDALKMLSRMVDPPLKFRRDGDVYIISQANPDNDHGEESPITSAGPSERKVTVQVKDTPLSDVLEQLFKGMGLNYVFEDQDIAHSVLSVPISMKLKDVPFADALQHLLGKLNLQYRIEGKVYVFTTKSDVAAQEKRVTLDLKNADLKDAFQALFNGTGLDYVLSPAVTQPGMDLLRIGSLQLHDVPFETALKRILDTFNIILLPYYPSKRLTYHVQDGIYVINTQAATDPALDQIGEQGLPAVTGGLSGLVTMRIPPMRVADAIAKIEPGWSFKGKLGDATMPGASFYQFPRDMAAGMVLIAAGLVPPVDMSKIVTAKGRADLSTLYQWTPPKQAYEYSGYRPPGLPSGGGLAGFGSNAIAIGSYKTDTGWLYTVLTSGAQDIDLIQALFITSGASYVMSDRNSLSPGPIMRLPKAVSVQLYDLTLDQTLDAILPTVGLAYRKEGSPDKPTYRIEQSSEEAPQPTGVYSTGGGFGQYGGRIKQ